VYDYSGDTSLGIAYQSSIDGEVVTTALASHNASLADNLYSFANMFFGFIPGSIGETSTLMVLIGAAILILTGVGSWKIIVSAFAGTWVMGLVMNLLAANEYMAMPAHYHLVL